MRAVVLTEHGGPEVLIVRDVPVPVPGPEEVLVAVAATAVNRADLLQRMGFYPGPPMDHEIPGLELAGRVVALGARATRWRVGDAVMAVVGGGAYAEQIAVHERQLMAVPDGMSLSDAAAIPEVFITAWDALVVQGGLTTGGRALVHAGASGVGTAAIQIARWQHASVAVTASAAKLDACRSLGARLAVERSPADWLGPVREWAPDGVDAILDVVGGDELDRNVRAVRVGGRIVQVGVMAGGRVAFDLGALLPKRASLVGTVLRARPLEEKIAISRRFAAEVLPGFAQGVLRPVIHARLPLERIGEAHGMLESNATVGKVVIDVNDLDGQAG